MVQLCPMGDVLHKIYYTLKSHIIFFKYVVRGLFLTPTALNLQFKTK